MTEDILVLRWLTSKKHKRSDSFVPEIILVFTTLLSAFFWNRSINTAGGIILFILWVVILDLLLSLALNNLKTMLLPNKLVYPLGIVVAIFVITSSIQQGSASVLWESILGSLLLGSIPCLVFILSKGSWIGFGDVRMGFIAGFLLGWKYSLLCLALILVLLALAFVFFYTASKITKNPTSPKLETGMLWATSIIVCFLFGHYLIK